MPYDRWAGRCSNSPDPGPNLTRDPNMSNPRCTTAGCTNICRYGVAKPCGSCEVWSRRNGGADPSRRRGLNPHPECKELNCDKPSCALGWCSKHYVRNKRHGSPNVTTKRAHGMVTELIEQGAAPNTDKCIIVSHRSGRGHVLFRGVGMAASRAAWIIANGDPGPLFVLHRCNGGSGEHGCVNVRHLYLGTAWKNRQDAVTSDQVTFGERHHKAVLTEADVRKIRATYDSSSATGVAMARRYGVTPTTISRVARGLSWRRVA